ncbi:DUF371 domain-containing protein [soil metagenome]
MVQDDVMFHGHPNILSFHKRSVEITRDGDLSRRGDCIIGVGSNKGCGLLDQRLRHAIGTDSAQIRMEIIVDELSFIILGRGNDDLLALDKRDIVIRKSSFCCPRTLSVSCDKAASDIPSDMVERLKNSDTNGMLRITVE